MSIKECLINTRTITATFPASTAVAVGDLLWNNSGVAAKASAQADQGTEATNQLLFKSLFLGVSADQRLATETDTGTRLVVTDGVFDCTSPARSWKIGDLVAASEASNGTELENQQVEYTTDASIAIGYCVMDSAASATKVRCRLISHYLPNTVNRGALDTSLADDTPIIFGTGSDAKVEWSTGDASNHTTVFALGDSNQSIHFTDVGAISTDWDVSAETHPSVYVHSNTTPATDYMIVGRHDGTSCWVDANGATNLKLGHAGLESLILVTASSAVNEVTITPAATGVAPSIAASGGDTHVTLELSAKGTTGVVQVTDPLVHKMTQAATTDTATITIAQLLTKILDATPTAAATYTLPTAALLVAGITNAKVGDSFSFLINNKSGGANTITVAAGSGGTADGTLTIAQNVIRRYTIIITNVTGSSESYFVYGEG